MLFQWNYGIKYQSREETVHYNEVTIREQDRINI